MLNKEEAIRVVTQSRSSKHGGPRKVYIFKCNEINCLTEIRARVDHLTRHSGKCLVHSHQKRPFETIFNEFMVDARQRFSNNTLTYNEFLTFTNNKKCHYCFIKIEWNPYFQSKGKYISKAYYLDRKDNNMGYTRDNCVVCCTRCNIAKSNKFTYNEWYAMTEYFRKKAGIENDCFKRR